jgi:DMSO/TMAO reductase YedYZ molybdopterin-dependent catalytic subunit
VGDGERVTGEDVMDLFVVRHRHEASSCPARDADTGAALLNHLSRPNVRGNGISIRGEAVVEREHTLYMIVEAADEGRVRTFMEPFAQAGSVDVYRASTCVGVVANGGCEPPAPPVSDRVPTVDPAGACQQALEDGLLVHRADPLNCETSLPDLIGGVVMPNARFYVRNHFQIPSVQASTWRLALSGLVERHLELSLGQLTRMRSETLVVTLECAGNGRAGVQPRVDGEQWRHGAVSTAEWTGVPLVEVLDRGGIDPAASELVFRGADRGAVEGRGTIAFERSLPIDAARQSNALLAYAMNGEVLPVEHGYPLRLVVPGWYGVASVKWLTEIDAVAEPFGGYFQADRYWYEADADSSATRKPVTLQRVRALITEPAGDAVLRRGELAVRGVAWSGAAPIARVEVGIDDGPWREAHLVGVRHRHGWQRWELITRVDRPGSIALRCRATDEAGRTQPDVARWNRHGYGNNAVQVVDVTIV